MISDPEDTEELCEVYRPAFIRLLADNPRFGLRQIAPLTPSVTRVETMEQLRQLVSLQKNPRRAMFRPTCASASVLSRSSCLTCRNA